MLKTDLLEIMEAVEDERLGDVSVQWKSGACACVILASGGYPEKYETGKEIAGLDDKGQCAGASVYHAGTKLSEDGKFLTAGGRVLGVTASGENLRAALDSAYKAAEQIAFDGVHYRKDIGQRALAAKG
jgi:phosphoribosylamine--glycine ligase